MRFRSDSRFLTRPPVRRSSGGRRVEISYNPNSREAHEHIAELRIICLQRKPDAHPSAFVVRHKSPMVGKQGPDRARKCLAEIQELTRGANFCSARMYRTSALQLLELAPQHQRPSRQRHRRRLARGLGLPSSSRRPSS